jgi:hypothetical protein
MPGLARKELPEFALQIIIFFFFLLLFCFEYINQPSTPSLISSDFRASIERILHPP